MLLMMITITRPCGYSDDIDDDADDGTYDRNDDDINDDNDDDPYNYADDTDDDNDHKNDSYTAAGAGPLVMASWSAVFARTLSFTF